MLEERGRRARSRGPICGGPSVCIRVCVCEGVCVCAQESEREKERERAYIQTQR